MGRAVFLSYNSEYNKIAVESCNIVCCPNVAHRIQSESIFSFVSYYPFIFVE